jgi:hypothetical protein
MLGIRFAIELLNRNQTTFIRFTGRWFREESVLEVLQFLKEVPILEFAGWFVATFVSIAVMDRVIDLTMDFYGGGKEEGMSLGFGGIGKGVRDILGKLWGWAVSMLAFVGNLPDRLWMWVMEGNVDRRSWLSEDTSKTDEVETTKRDETPPLRPDTSGPSIQFNKPSTGNNDLASDLWIFRGISQLWNSTTTFAIRTWQWLMSFLWRSIASLGPWFRRIGKRATQPLQEIGVTKPSDQQIPSTAEEAESMTGGLASTQSVVEDTQDIASAALTNSESPYNEVFDPEAEYLEAEPSSTENAESSTTPTTTSPHSTRA